jgi:hypothetical protein
VTEFHGVNVIGRIVDTAHHSSSGTEVQGGTQYQLSRKKSKRGKSFSDLLIITEKENT